MSPMISLQSLALQAQAAAPDLVHTASIVDEQLPFG